MLPALVSGMLLAALLVAPAPAEIPVVEVPCTTVWDIPGETADYLLGGLLVDAGWDRDGNLCLVDYENKDLKVFAADGRYLRTLGREGGGPGQSRDARRLLQADDGRLGLLQMFPATVVWLRPDGTPAGKLALKNTLNGGEGYVGLPHAVQYPGGIMAYISAMAMTDSGPSENHWIAPLNLDGTFGAPLWHQEVDPAVPGQVDERELYAVWASRWAPDGSGGVFVADDRDRYRIVHIGPDGVRSGVLERSYQPVVRDELGRYQAQESWQRKHYGPERIRLADTDPVVNRLRLAANRDLWVDLALGGNGPAPGTIAHIDVWSPDGRRLRQLQVRGDFDPDGDQRLFLDDHHLLVLHVDENDAVHLRLLHLERGSG